MDTLYGGRIKWKLHNDKKYNVVKSMAYNGTIKRGNALPRLSS
jgi:hypothetical protein